MDTTHTHASLVELAYGWVLRRTPCGFAFRELRSMSNEIPDVVGFGSWNFSVLVECKVSRSDFLADARKPWRRGQPGIGRFRFYACPKGLLSVKDMPEGYGLLHADGGRIRVIHNPFLLGPGSNVWHGGFEPNTHAERALMYTALRRLNLRGHLPCIYDKQYNLTGQPATNS